MSNGKYWTPCPDALIEAAPKIGGGLVVLVYLAIAKRADKTTGECFPKIKSIASDVGVTQRSVKTHIETLKRIGAIGVKRTGRSSVYTIDPRSEISFTSEVKPVSPQKCNEVQGEVKPVSPQSESGALYELEPVNKKPGNKPKRKSPCDIPIPKCLDTPEFRSAWSEWLNYRRERKLTLTDRTLNGQLKKLAEVPTRAASLIEDSIANGWQSVCYPSQIENRNGKQEQPGPGQHYDAKAVGVGDF